MSKPSEVKTSSHQTEDYDVEDAPKTRQLNESETTFQVSTDNLADRKIRFYGIIYFVVLFIILGSYIAVSIPDDAIRLHIYAADSLSKTQQNAVLVRARNLNNGSVFKGYKLAIYWIFGDEDPYFTIGNTYVHYVEREMVEMVQLRAWTIAEFVKVYKGIVPLNENGEQMVAVPMDGATYGSYLAITLIDPEGEAVKTALVPRELFENTRDDSGSTLGQTVAEARSLPKDWIMVDTPSAFMIDQENEVRIMAFEGNKPYEGTLSIEQTYGDKATFPATVEADPSGITSIKVKLKYAADFKITAGQTVGYASFVANEKTFHAHLMSYPFLGFHVSPNHEQEEDELEHRKFAKVPLKVIVSGAMPDLTIDYFDGNAWLDRRVIKGNIVEQFGGIIDIAPDVDKYTLRNENQILYVRVSTSSIPSPESSQTFILVNSTSSPIEEAYYFLGLLAPYRAENPIIAEFEEQLGLLDCKSGYFYNRNPDCLRAAKIRDEAMTILARYHAPDINLRVKTEDHDASELDSRKRTHKYVMNVVLILWFLLGLIGGGVVAYRQVQQRRMLWYELMSGGMAEVEQEIPTISVGLAFGLIVLFIGLCWSLYYMMQLL